MKLLILAILLPCCVAAQDTSFQFKLMDSVQATKLELYSRARQFVATSFNNSKAVIQMDDKDIGKIICKAVMTPSAVVALGVQSESIIDYVITIDIKDNKYRCVLSDFYHKGFKGNSNNNRVCSLADDKQECATKKYWLRIKDKVSKDALSFLDELKISMNKKMPYGDF